MRRCFFDREPHSKPADCKAVCKEEDKAEEAKDNPKHSVVWRSESSRVDPRKEQDFSRKQCQKRRPEQTSKRQPVACDHVSDAQGSREQQFKRGFLAVGVQGRAGSLS